MKAVILAAGLGKRLGPLAEGRPKVMIPVRGKPPLERHIERLGRAGVKEIFINLHHQPQAITGYFGDGERWGVRLRYAYEPELLGTAGAVRSFGPHLTGGPFLVVYGDNTVDIDYADFIRFGEGTESLGVIAVQFRDDVSGSGIVEFGPDGRIARFMEKPEAAAVFSRWASAGIYRFGPRVLEHLEPGYSDFGRDVFPRLLKRGVALTAYPLEVPLIAIDTPELLEEASRAGREPS